MNPSLPPALFVYGTLVECHEDHISAAEMFGWKSPDGIDDQDSALDWLMEKIGETIEAPPHVVEYFEQDQEEDESEA